MEATRQYRKARALWNGARGRHVVRLRHIVARHAKAIQEKTIAGQTRRASVANEIAMLAQVGAHEKAVQHEINTVIVTNSEVYRDALARVVLARSGQVQIVKGETRVPVTPFEYKAIRLSPQQALGELVAA